MAAQAINQGDEKRVLESYNEANLAEPIPPNDIVSYNELRSCADLFRLFEGGKLEIQPDFQREVVWRAEEQGRFIDSLVKQLPIPSMCFSLDYKTQKWKVIDGLQRMSSIISFLGIAPWRIKKLDDIHPLLRGTRNIDLRDGNEELKMLFETVQNVSIPITILRCDYSQPAHMNYLFTIFHRLNSGGVKLNNQEIRNCIYSGSFNNYLKKFDRENPDWNAVQKRIWGSSKRFRSIELLLRAIAFSENLDNYDGNLARFLNRFMHDNMDLSQEQIGDLDAKLSRMARAARISLSDPSSSKISLTYIEATLVGILNNIESVNEASDDELRLAFNSMIDKLIEADLARYAIASETNVRARMMISESCYSLFPR